MAIAILRGISGQTRRNRWFYFTLFAWFAAIAAKVSTMAGLSTAQQVAVAVHLGLYGGMLIAMIALDMADSLRPWFAERPSRFRLLIAANIALTVSFQLAMGQVSAAALGGGILYWLVAMGLLSKAQHNKEQCGGYDILLLLSLWAPIHSGLLSAVYGPLLPGLPWLMAIPAATVTLAIATITVRQFEDVGLSLRHLGQWSTWRAAAGYLALAAIALMGYHAALGTPLAVGERLADAPLGAETFIGVIIFASLPSELLFRGLILNILEKTSGSTWLAVAVAALISGVAGAGLNPDPAQVGAGLIAGGFLGLIYLKSGSIIPGAVASAVIALFLGGTPGL